MKQLMGEDWSDDFSLERVEFLGIKAVHFVIYGVLGRGVTSSPVLDNLGKGFADYIRGKHVEIPIDSISAHGPTYREDFAKTVSVPGRIVFKVTLYHYQETVLLFNIWSRIICLRCLRLQARYSPYHLTDCQHRR